MRKRRYVQRVGINLLLCVVLNLYVGKGWSLMMCYGVAWYGVFLTPYAWKKTKICPLEIMMRCSILRWPRAFRLMYKESSTTLICPVSAPVQVL